MKAIENLVAYLKTQGHSEAVARELTQAETRVRTLGPSSGRMPIGRLVFPPPTKAIRDGLLRLEAA